MKRFRNVNSPCSKSTSRSTETGRCAHHRAVVIVTAFEREWVMLSNQPCLRLLGKYINLCEDDIVDFKALSVWLSARLFVQVSCKNQIFECIWLKSSLIFRQLNHNKNMESDIYKPQTTSHWFSGMSLTRGLMYFTLHK